MTIDYRTAKLPDAPLLVKLYDAAFYSDYIRYGECPGYGKSEESMRDSIRRVPKRIILCDGKPVGVISCKKTAEYSYEIGCLCVLPAYQGRGIGTKAVEDTLAYYSDWKKVTLVTPADKEENVKFYTQKCGFRIEKAEIDGHVKVYRFVRER